MKTPDCSISPTPQAGRIPSDSGYRAYVNELMTPSEPLTRQMEHTISQRFSQRLDWNGQVMEALLQESAQVLASLSGYIALVTMPHRNEATIKHLQLVRVSDDQLLLVVIDTCDNHSVLMSMPRREGAGVTGSQGEGVSDRELQILSNFLTEQLKGQALREVRLDWSELDRAFERYALDLEQAIVDLVRRSRTNPATQILISGLAEVLDQPEFSQRSQIRSIVELLEDGRDQLWPLISAASTRSDGLSGETPGEDLLGNRRLRIWIGAENPVEPMQSCALVTTMYGTPPGPVGSLGVLGPTRMLYENAVAAVEAAANYLTDAVADTLEMSDRLTPEG